MMISELQKRLCEKERELWADMTRTAAEARGVGIPEPRNGVASAESKESLFQDTTSDWNVFTQVREALQRIEIGYLREMCGVWRPIEPQRLDSVPWTPYCIEDQNRRDRDLAARRL